jgi:hypothetical protein
MPVIVNYFELQNKILSPTEGHEKQETGLEINFVDVVLCEVSDSFCIIL